MTQPNNNPVSQALQQIEGVHQARRRLTELHHQQESRGGKYSEAHGQRVASEYDNIRTGLRLADSYALVAQAAALQSIASSLLRLAPAPQDRTDRGAVVL